MSDSASRLREAREKAGYATAKLAAEAMGVPVSTYIQHENGGRGYPADRAARYASFFKTTPKWLIYGTGRTKEPPPLGGIPILGGVPAGSLKEAFADRVGTMPRVSPDIPEKAFALQVRGSSMDLIVPDGGYVVVDPGRVDPFPGWFYVIETEDGETTFKEYQDGPPRLEPCSSDPSHKPIFFGDGQGFRIVGKVIWYAGRMPNGRKR